MDEVVIKCVFIWVSYEIIEWNKGMKNLVFVGIKMCGIYFVECLYKCIFEIEGIDVLVGDIDIIFYWDDLFFKDDKICEFVVYGMNILFDINGKKVVFVDDVFYIGWIVCVVMDVLMDVGRFV